MTRVFLKLYFLLVLPLLIMALLPQSPFSILGNWWYEKEAQREYGAIYPLVKEELDLIPQAQWMEKVKEIGQNFAYPLVLMKRRDSSLKKEINEKIDSKGFALSTYQRNPTLIYAVKNSPFLLYASLSSKNSNLEEFERDTRGFRYFLNKKVKDSKNPLEEFERIKSYFSVKLKMYHVEDFKKIHNNNEILSTLLKKQLFIDYDKTNLAYLLSEDKQYIVVITGSNARATYRRYSQYLSFIVPAILLAIGALLWMVLFRKEFRKVNKAAKTFGHGQLNTRIELSKNSALYPIAGSFNNMATRIEALLEGQKDLTNAVSHELKTPLSRLHFALEMQKTSNTEKEREIYTNKIENNISALENLVDELLNYTRLQGKQRTHFKAYPFQKWLENEVVIFAEYHPEIKIISEIEINRNIVFDAHLMSRALNNLLDNAANYTNPDTAMIKISAKQILKDIRITVEDNGKGIKPQDCEKIFDPFTRLDKSRQRKDNKSLNGYGMGLAIVKSIMKQHKGDVECSNSSFGGAAFTLIWPAELGSFK